MINKRQLVVVWIAATYLAVTASSFLLRAYYRKYHLEPWVETAAGRAEKGLEELRTGHSELEGTPTKYKEVVGKLDEFEEEYISRGPRQPFGIPKKINIIRLPDVLVIGLPFAICLSAVGIYVLRSHHKNG